MRSPYQHRIVLSRLGKAFSLSLLFASLNSHSNDLQKTLDWVPFDALTADQRQALPPGSCGAYIAPLRTDTEAKLNPEAAPIRANADQATTFGDRNSPENKRVLLVGDVVVTQGYRQLKANRAELDQSTGQLVMEGNIEIREPDLLILGEKTLVNQNNNTANVDQATFVSHSSAVRGGARHLTRSGEKQLNLKSGSFTHCEPGNNHWVLKGSRIYLDNEKHQGHAYNARLVVAGLPVFYSPYLRFPLGNGRMTGFLYPSFSFENDNRNISIPYYVNLAPNYDWLLTPHYMERHGILYENHFRHLSRYFYTQLNTAYLTDDRGKLEDDEQDRVNNGEVTEAQLVPFKGKDRWLVHLDQQGGEGRNWSTRINYAEVSDINYFRDFDFNPIADNDDNFLDQKIKTTYQIDHWTFAVDSIIYQTLSETVAVPYEQLPALSADGTYSWGNWALSLDHEWIYFDHPDADADTPRLVGNRLRLDYRLGWDFEPEWGFIKSAIQAKHLQYELNDNNFTAGADDQPSISVPQLTLDTGLFFERDGAGYLQTFEPRLFYIYSDFEDHSPLFNLTNDGQGVDFDTSELTFSYSGLFRDTRFSGGDRIDDANQLAVGLTTRFFGNESGLEWFSASAGQITYFDDRRVTLNNNPNTGKESDIALQLGSSPIRGLRFSGNALFDDLNDEVKQWNIRARYQSPNKHLLDLNYRFSRGSSEDTREAKAALIAPLFDSRWHFLIYYSRDIERERELDSISAIEYNGCCIRLRFGYRSELDNRLLNVLPGEDLDYDYTGFFEVHFKGLGGNSKTLDNLFTDNIDGYEAWQALFHSK